MKNPLFESKKDGSVRGSSDRINRLMNNKLSKNRNLVQSLNLNRQSYGSSRRNKHSKINPRTSSKNVSKRSIHKSGKNIDMRKSSDNRSIRVSRNNSRRSSKIIGELTMPKLKQKFYKEKQKVKIQVPIIHTQVKTEPNEQIAELSNISEGVEQIKGISSNQLNLFFKKANLKMQQDGITEET